MSLYRLKYNESESNIKIYNFFYRNTKKSKTLSNQNENENFKTPIFSKKHNNILHSVYVPQLILLLYFFLFLCFYSFEKWNIWKLQQFQKLVFYLVLGIRSIIHNFIVFIFVYFSIFILLYLYFYLFFIFLYIFICSYN